MMMASSSPNRPSPFSLRGGGSGSSRNRRSLSFSRVDESGASGVLSEILRDCGASLGGCSIGRGFKRAALGVLEERRARDDALVDYAIAEGLDENEGATEAEVKSNHASNANNANANNNNNIVAAGGGGGFLSDDSSFYIVDIGVVVSQVYQWRRFFPRVEPFYAVKCNPDPNIVRVLGALGCNFDCASRGEIDLVRRVCDTLPHRGAVDVVYANPCKSPSHVAHAVRNGVDLMTFDNANEIEKCARISSKIRLILRIITDDRGSQCRLSSKFGAPRHRWRELLERARHHGVPVVGVSFHVGSGCRDASRYEMALNDAREVFDMAAECGHEMSILDIGGGFPGETHGLWNPAVVDDDEEEEEDEDPEVGKQATPPPSERSSSDGELKEEEKDEAAAAAEGDGQQRFMFFNEIAEQVAPIIDELFPPESNVRVIAEPGRYFVAAAATLCCSVMSARCNILDDADSPQNINDREVCDRLQKESSHRRMISQGGDAGGGGGGGGDSCPNTPRGSRRLRSHSRGLSIGGGGLVDSVSDDLVMQTIRDELQDYAQLYASQQITQQEVDVYNDPLDLYREGYNTATDLLGPPNVEQRKSTHYTVEGMNYSLISAATDGETGAEGDGSNNNAAGGEEEGPSAIITLAAAGEAAVSGIVMQAVADSGTLQDDYAYYVNEGVYGCFNNLMFDHASCRPRVLRSGSGPSANGGKRLHTSTVFGNTCDSIDVVARSVLLPELKIGDWLYFENMGAYTSAAASGFNGFEPSEKVYVCSVQPEYFEALAAGPEQVEEEAEEKKDDTAE